MKRVVFSSIIIFFFLVCLEMNMSFEERQVSAAVLNDTMVVEANIIGFANISSEEEIVIEVPDYVFLGNVTKDNPESEEVKVYINNTGNTPILVTPLLKDPDEKIFSYLFFRTYKTSNGTEVEPQRIGEYSIEIDKPLSGNRARSKYCYMKLDLNNFDGEIKEDLIGYRTDILFLAMPQ